MQQNMQMRLCWTLYDSDRRLEMANRAALIDECWKQSNENDAIYKMGRN